MIRGIVFDLDGVLVDAADWHYQALNRALGLFGYGIDPKDHAQNYNGLPTLVKLPLLSRKTGFPIVLHPFVNEMKQKYTREIFLKECRPQEKITSALTQFRKRGLRLAVASNSSRATVDLALDGLGIKQYFDAVLSHEDAGAPKPHPGIYHETFRQLGLCAQDVLVLEDSGPGLEAAYASHAHVLKIDNPSDVTFENIRNHIDRITRSVDLTPALPTIEILVPMAGAGSRFLEAGFSRPKPFISVLGKPMIEWVVENVRPLRYPHVFTFLANESHLRHVPYENLLRRLAPGSRVVKVPATTQGAACTALLGMESAVKDRPLVIVNSDQWVDFSMDDFLDESLMAACDGNILTFRAQEDKWSYAKLNSEGFVTEVAEKRPISENATVGIYFFRKVSTFHQAAQAMIRKDLRTRNEFYLCPVYNEIIQDFGRVRTSEITPQAMHGLGTPQDLEKFLQLQSNGAPPFGKPAGFVPPPGPSERV